MQLRHERIEQMWNAYQSGESLAEVGAKFGVSRERVRQILAQAGYSTRTRHEAQQNRRKRFRRQVRQDLHQLGHFDSPKEAADRLGVTTEAVRQALKEAPVLDIPEEGG